ncbi:MAG: bifunctional DNA-formamidopyrimidine glycosylase/DNA-(apurinic or apyrimidinic site) lyase [Firmicutes bacterium]|nr:bifunctional DNA-formamidopyrimidine glycosylase/DNA-(apurinic or apyrimidinic site) lyase [Bacillota bacterium]
MPELPEVETIRRTLEPRLVGRTIKRVEVRNPKFVAGAGPEAFARTVEGARVRALERRGKFLIIKLEAPASDGRPSPGSPEALDILVHLKMAGQLVWCRPEEDLGPTRTKHTHVVFGLDDGSELRYVDVRHFGRIYFPTGDGGDPLVRRALRTLGELGPEPREGGLAWEQFRRMLASRHARLKPLLLDQSFVAGLGNIYSDECLFRAGVHPLRKASSLTEEEARRLYEAIHEVLEEAIRLHGTSVRDYVDGEGRRGEFAERLEVYGRPGEPCLRCGTPIARIVLGGRSTHFCPRCQPARDDSRTNV